MGGYLVSITESPKSFASEGSCLEVTFDWDALPQVIPEDGKLFADSLPKISRITSNIHAPNG
jgi:hypothetical protein